MRIDRLQVIFKNLPIQTQADLLSEIKKLGFRDFDLRIREELDFKYKITIMEGDRREVIYLEYKKIREDRKLENLTHKEWEEYTRKILNSKLFSDLLIYKIEGENPYLKPETHSKALPAIFNTATEVI